MIEARNASAHGVSYPGAIDLEALRTAHADRYPEPAVLQADGNTAAAIPFLQWWRSPIVAGFPITPSTKWIEHLAAESGSGRFDVEIGGRRVAGKRVKLLEAEHAVADYLVGLAAGCRDLIAGTATSSVGLDHMTETLRSLGASGLGNVVVVNVCRATANYPLCIEGDPSDHLAHRDDGFVQVMCRGKQQIYDTLLQLPAIGMHPQVLTPTMAAFYGIKDSHRAGRLRVEPDAGVNRFLEDALALGRSEAALPGLLDGDTSMGNCVTSGYFQGFKTGQKKRLQAVLEVLPRVAALFAERFGRRGIEPFESHGMADHPEIALVCMGPDAGTAIQLRPRLERELRARIGVIVPRLLTPFPAEALGEALRGAVAVGVVNNAFHHGRGHLTLDVRDAIPGRIPVDSFFCGLGGADVSPATFRTIAREVCDTAGRGKPARPWHLLHDGVELTEA